MTNPSEARYTQAKAQSLLKEHGQFLELIIAEVKREYESEIIGTTADEIALEYKRRQGAKEALALFMKRVNSKADERH